MPLFMLKNFSVKLCCKRVRNTSKTAPKPVFERLPLCVRQLGKVYKLEMHAKNKKESFTKIM